jgi:hypothetical protein
MADTPLTGRRIFHFWLPLSVMWLMMGVEIYLVTAFIARLPDPKEQLAAFTLTFSMALVVESPVLMPEFELARHKKRVGLT